MGRRQLTDEQKRLRKEAKKQRQIEAREAKLRETQQLDAARHERESERQYRRYHTHNAHKHTST
jgi:hypothetical protein